jgi:hypothetical protein
MFTKTLAAATASALLAGSAVAFTGVAAETHSTKAAHPPATMQQALAKRQTRVVKRQAELAQRLGVSADRLKAANAALLTRSLDVRVAAGRLTVAQRSAILACKAAPLTCDRTYLPAKGGTKAIKRKAAKHRKNATKRLEKRATALAGELKLDRAKVLDALKAQRKAHAKG